MNRAGGLSNFQQSEQNQFSENSLLPYRAAGLALGNEGAAINNQSGLVGLEGAKLAQRFNEETFSIRIAGANQQYQGAEVANAVALLDLTTKQNLFRNIIDEAAANLQIKQTEAEAARQLMAQGGEWWNSPLFKNILRVSLVGGGAAIGLAVGGPAGALAGAGLGAQGAAGIK